MLQETALSTAQDWQDAANTQDVTRLLELSSPNIEIVGPRGSGYGHQLLQDWLTRAGLTLTTLQAYAKGNTVVLRQHGVWRSAEGEVMGEADLASVFRVEGGCIAYFARYNSIEEALQKAGLDPSDQAASSES